MAKAKQATARKKMIDKLNIEDIKPSSRRYPAIIFEQEREAGDQILEVKDLEKTKDNELLFSGINLNLKKGDKVAVLSKTLWLSLNSWRLLQETILQIKVLSTGV